MANSANSGENRDFAFGRNETDGCSCPAVTAGFDPITNETLLSVAEQYDDEIQTDVGISHGVVDESKAKEAWLNVIEHYGDFDDEEMHPTYREEREEARKIAAELGWLDDE